MNAATVPDRPIVRYHGGKWRLAPWIVSHFPAHAVYVEPFGGGGSVLLRKPRSYGEVYNDKDGEIVNLFRVARDYGDELIRAIYLTPFARDEFVGSYVPDSCPIEQARRTVVRAFMGYGSASANGQVSGFRASVSRESTTPPADFANYPESLRRVIERLRGVVIENRDAVQVMESHDCEDALHYVDPPYVHATRNIRERSLAYRFEMTDDDHRRMASALRELRGRVIVSGYRCDLYDELFEGWVRVDKAAHADGAKPRVESLWMSPNCEVRQLFN